MDLSPLVVIVVGIIVLGLIWRVVKGIIRLVLTVGMLLLVGYVVLNYLQ